MSGCPALLISAPASGQGKTTVTAALARFHRNRGRRMRVFKTGPDFLDPMILERASGASVYNLDLWMGGEVHCRELLSAAAGEADLILVEGVMGLYDGTPSSADLAALFGIPVLAVIEASAMAQTFGALAHGLATFRPGLPFAGVLANRVGSESHAAMLRESLPPGLRFFGTLPRSAELALPERHLGLVQSQEIADLDARLDHAAAALDAAWADALPEPVDFHATETEPLPRLLDGVRIAVARDAAFAFLYPANLDVLRALGAELLFFSPLAGDTLPEADAVWLPGGYPELHLSALAENRRLKDSLRAHCRAGKPLWAECGGLLYLLESLADASGRTGEMAGLLPGQGALQNGLVNLGLQALDLPEGELRGHSFHHARADVALEPAMHTRAARHHGRPEAVWRVGRLTASFFHAYFPSNPQAVAALFRP
ncbi:cobyrinate a,c-diamide synthase [Methylococcus sp. EFPC2]|uniref:cobyrinate a,c-diamide synthase n=1 Tax=Methylococcus sp. EFPC2 TaxID=2812648 RepID=UPI0019671288|nr:cobyrinate a,c-diamide synthase [Methylococcus sp. EFPC2]QSA98750.1 cobyrinate a,c-diamide synthase [Methylococcus sp. EFPC2]